MSLGTDSAGRLAALRQARDRALAAPRDRAAFDAFAEAAAALERALETDGHLSAEARNEAGRVARSRYAGLCRDIAAGRLRYDLAAAAPDDDDAAPDGAPRVTLSDGTGFDAAGFIRRVAGDWESVAAAA